MKNQMPDQKLLHRKEELRSIIIFTLPVYTCMLYFQMNKPPINIIQYNKLHTPIKCEVDMISKWIKGFEY